MKIKNVFLRVASLVLSLLLCFSVVSCKNDKDDDKEIYKTNVKGVGHAAYGNFVYSHMGKMIRFNRKTETLSAACQDLECDGTCPLDSVQSLIAGIYDGRLYFCAWQQFTSDVFMAYQDIISGEVIVLKKLSKIEDSGGYLIFVDDDYVYFKCKILKKDSDASIATNYESHISRIHKDGGKDEPVIKCEDSELFHMAADGKLITALNGKLYSTDVNSKNKKEIFDFNAHGYTGLVSFMSFLDGKLYFLASSGLTQTSEYNKRTYNLDFLVWLDINEGETDRAVENPVASFSLTDDAIYFAPFKLRHLYIPEDYATNPDKVTLTVIDESLYACDLDGGNIRKVYANDSLSYADNFIVVDGKIYGWMFDYDEKSHSFSNVMLFGAIDMKSGKIVKPEKLKQ